MPSPDATAAIKWLLQLEDRNLSGEIVNLNDKAGLTRFGITQKWNAALVPAAFWTPTVLTDAAIIIATAFYNDYYWLKMDLDASPLPLPYKASILSCAVNCGFFLAKRLLNISGDNHQHFIDCWIAYYRSLNKPQFLDGWIRRASALYPDLPK